MSSKSKQRVQSLNRQVLGLVGYAAVTIAVLAIAIFFLARALRPPTLETLAGNVIDVAATMSGFDKPEIRVKAGEPVTVRLTSLDNQHHTDGGGQHQWAVDDLDVSVVAQPLSSNMVTFTPEKPGEYTFYCDICCGGRANPTMNGTLIVEA
jgi:heme/copper-type cytochrome/quinol oxidase subunit 2